MLKTNLCFSPSREKHIDLNAVKMLKICSFQGILISIRLERPFMRQVVQDRHLLCPMQGRIAAEYCELLHAYATQ